MQYVGTYLVPGDADTLGTLVTLLEKEGSIVKGSPDVYARFYDAFGIDDALEVRARAQTRALGAQRFFLIAAPHFTVEAQNALLKTLEEPGSGTVFFLIVQSPETLLATVRSRAQRFSIKEERPHSRSAAEFLRATPETRLGLLKPLLEVEGSAAVLSFLRDLEHVLGERRHDASRQESLRALYRARKFASDKGALRKVLLEQFALLAPTV